MRGTDGTASFAILRGCCGGSTFTKAASRLRLAQPALKRQVADLEDELAVRLLKRTAHDVVLTAEGKLFLEEAQ